MDLKISAIRGNLAAAAFIYDGVIVLRLFAVA